MARPNRIKPNAPSFYHVISRIANQAYLMDDKFKAKMLDVMYAAAEFSGVTIGTYMLMDNHFHLIVHVPSPDESIPDSLVLKRIQVLYGKIETERLADRWNKMRQEGRDAVADSEIARYRYRMHDISEFAKTFKQRITQWYNTNFGHVGTLWTGRFKSPLIELGEYLATCMKYIHNNPVAAKMTKSSSDYIWGAPGAALIGDIRAQKSLDFLNGVFKRCVDEGKFSWKDVVEPVGHDKRFSNGVVMGSKEFVEKYAPEMTTTRRRVWRPNLIAGRIYSSHGQRSAPGFIRAA